MKTTILFNPKGNDVEKQVFNGNTTGMCQLNNLAYPWARNLWDQMRSQFWQHQKIDLTNDVVDYNNLTNEERNAYNKTLGFLVFLDSIQINNLPYLKGPITAPEIGLCISEQTAQEALHSASYQYIIETVIPKEQRNKMYELWREDKLLQQRCCLISGIYQEYINNQTLENYLKALIADYILEGLYFYAGFNFFYTLASRSLMSGTADIIKLIHRDELSHVRIYQELVNEAYLQYPDNEVWNQVHNMFEEAIINEITWNNSICQNAILGITKESTKEYVYYLANVRLKGIKFNKFKEDYKNPYQHLERFSDLSNQATTKTNFFESTVTSYQTSSTIKEWDF
jgi:ribonucleoside-diphosphate reductase beta chain